MYIKKEVEIMKGVYQVLIKRTDDGYYVYIPDWDIHTQGSDLADSIEMARDAIGIMGIDYEDEKIKFPDVKDHERGDYDYLTWVDIDFKQYRLKLKNMSVRKNCTIPAWLNEKAEEQGINFSKILQDALLERLQV